MATTFNVIYLSQSSEQLDTFEGNDNAENASALVGRTHGTFEDPLYDRVQVFSPGSNGYGDSDPTAYDSDNSDASDTFHINGAGNHAFDTVVIYNATLTYVDGTTASIRAIVFQDKVGNRYLAPDPVEGSANQNALEAKPIATLKIDSIFDDQVSGLTADRAVSNYMQPDGFIDGTAGDDVIGDGYIDEDGDIVDGYDGDNDAIDGGAGNDVISSGLGDDFVFGNVGDDTLYGGAGEDALYGLDDNDLIYGGDDDDRLFGGTGNDYLAGGEGHDLLEGGTGNDQLQGDAGDDTLYGDGGSDGLYGGAGDDTLYGGGSRDYLWGGAGNDLLDAGNAADAIYAGAGDDTVYGGSGDDYIQLTSGNDTVYGGDDRENLHIIAGDYADGAVVTVDGGTGGVDNDNLTLTSWAAQRNLAYSTDADGDSVSGSVELYDGNGNWITVNFSEIESVSAPTTDLTPVREIDGTPGDDTIDSGYTDDPGGNMVDGGDSLLGNDSDFISAGDGNDSVNSGDGNDTVDGGAGDDTLDGGSGDDTLYGGAGDDTFSLSGEFGTDTVEGGEGGETTGDTLDLSGTTANLTVDLRDADAETGTITDGTNTVTYSEIENVALGSGDDTYLLGDGSGADTVADFDMTDSGDGTSRDQIDVNDLTSDGSTPVNAWDVVVTDTVGDGSGDAVLTFPNGESITLGGVSPSEVNTASSLNAIGIPCFTAGAHIETAQGDIPVENLRIGDLVRTWEHGFQPVRWIGSRKVTAFELAKNPDLKPVVIRKHAFNNSRKLLVSPQHGMVVDVDGESVLIRAKHLAEFFGDSVARVQSRVEDVTYYHFMFDQHQIVFADGCLTEAFYPGKFALSSIGHAVQTELFALFPELIRVAIGASDVGSVYSEPARHYLKRREVAELGSFPKAS